MSKSTIPPHLFCFGLGFSAKRLAERVRQQGWKISGTTRSPEKAQALREQGIEAYEFDGSTPLPASLFETITHCVISIPPGADGDPAARLHGEDLAKARHLAWAAYLSTTGVYGDWEGALVDEESPLRPTQARSQRRVEAEEAWMRLYQDHGLPIHLFRLAGIYGPGRNALATVRAGRAHRTIKPGQVFSRIHADDIAQTLLASMERPNPGRIYNVCDDDPAPPQDVILYACEMLQVAPPPEVPFETADLSPMAKSFYADNKLVSNQRMKDELGVRLIYPSYKDGLQAIVRADTETPS